MTGGPLLHRSMKGKLLLEKQAMRTDWSLIRVMMQTAIDACERLEELGIGEHDRSASTEIAGQKVSVFDIVTSAWTYPERLRYQIIRERHDRHADLPYVPEAARVLVNMAEACAELVGAWDAAPAQSACTNMVNWYREHALPGIEQALTADRQGQPPVASSNQSP